LIAGHQRSDQGTSCGEPRSKRDQTKDIHWEKIAMGAGTLVFYMGVKNLQNIMRKLIEHGRPPETPVAVISNGTLLTQQTVVGTLRDIAEKAWSANINPPAIIIVGDVVTLREKLRWFENGSLSISQAKPWLNSIQKRKALSAQEPFCS